MKQNPDVLLFDLGGVLLEFSGFRDLRALLRDRMAEPDIKDKWIACPIVREFEIGKLTPPRFCEQFVAAWDVGLAPDVFFAEFRSWARGLLPGARELLVRLRRKFRLAYLTNTNETYWELNMREQGIMGLFDAGFSSHQLGLHKPDPLIYQCALSELGVNSDAVVFFDDSRANVSAARNLGIRAFQVVGVDELRDCLIQLGLLTPTEFK